MNDKETLVNKYNPDKPNVAPSFVELSPDPLIRRAIALMKLKNRTKQYTAMKSRCNGKLRLSNS